MSLPITTDILSKMNSFNVSNNITSMAALNNGSNGSDLTNRGQGQGEDMSYTMYWLPWWQQIIFYTLFVVMFIIAAGGNIIVIWIVLAHKRMRTVTNYFLVNLAVADALISIFNIPYHFTFNMYQDWYFGLEYCKFSFFIVPCTISVSVLTFMAIAVDRYIAIIHPLRPRLTGRIVFTVISAIWLVSFLLSLPNILYATVYVYHDQDDRTVCYLNWPDITEEAPSKQELIYNIIIMVTNYVLPIITLGVTYTRIGFELWGSKAIGEAVPMQTERVKSKRKVVKMMIAVVVIFAVCWLPTHVYFVLSQVYPEVNKWEHIQPVYIFIYWLAMSNSMYNPIIYCLMNARYRQGFFRFFRWCPCQTCRRGENLLVMERVFYSTRKGSERCDKNGSLLHTTMESFDENASSTTMSTYRMQPISSRPRNGNSHNNRHRC